MATTTFIWKGQSPKGEALSGELVATSKQAAIADLRRRRITIGSVKPKGREINLSAFNKGVSVKDLSIFTRSSPPW